ncbi:MAG: rhodanese-like domain-containing protein [Methylococcales bacterium]|jgi:phage shock protein E|nr:rhodanese-like domain-containing protein [Methylococcales bacterium]MBT7409589.1 rhodanese-like domain-containing protein [Methylococcales bacterium]
MKIFKAIFILLCVTILFGCTTSVTSQNVYKKVQNKSIKPMIIDVRTEGEFKAGHVPGAVNLSLTSLIGRTDEINVKPNDPIIVYCEHGPRASLAGVILKWSGFDNIQHLEGDMSGWREQRLPVEK